MLAGGMSAIELFALLDGLGLCCRVGAQRHGCCLQVSGLSRGCLPTMRCQGRGHPHCIARALQRARNLTPCHFWLLCLQARSYDEATNSPVGWYLR